MADSINGKVRFGPFDVDLRTRELWKNGQKLKLGGQPFEILAALLEKPGELVTREQLRARIWSADTFVDFNHGLNAAVNKLRETLGDSAEEPRYVETLPRRGYRFIASLELAAVPQPAAAPESAPPNIDSAAWTIPVGSGSPRYVWALASAVVLISFLGLWVGVDYYRSWIGSTLERERKETKEHEILAARFVTPPPGIWHLNLAFPREPKPRTVLTSGKERNEGAQPSPDGKKIAFMSDRSGSLEIWTMNRDGSSPEKLTDLGNCGSPRWSPDGRWIAFDAVVDGPPAIFVVAADGGPAQKVVANEWESMVPSWSNDGKWIYFASHRSGDDQVWRVPFGGGPAVQVTQQGGFATAESFDGETLYYAKTRFENPEIWKVPVGGGAERRVSPLLHPKTWANWALTENGILFLNAENDPSVTLEFFDFATSGVRPVSELEKPSFWLSATKDAKSAWYSWKNEEENRAALRLQFH